MAACGQSQYVTALGTLYIVGRLSTNELIKDTGASLSVNVRANSSGASKSLLIVLGSGLGSRSGGNQL